MRRAQRGVTLLALLAILVLGTAWWIVSGLARPINRAAQDRTQNASALLQAKAALIGYVAQTAAQTTENNPGRLPCPQAWGDVGTNNEGRASGSCASTAFGWLPWRTLGLPLSYDASGRQFWYIVSPGWHLVPAGGNLTINSNTPGQLTLDGTAVVALIIAPGAPLNISPSSAQSAAGCSARVQRQELAKNPDGTLSSNPNPLDFLECYSGTSFRSTVTDNVTNPVLNDQVVAITAADIMPALEAAIAKRIESQVIPSLKSVYAAAMWGTSTTNPVFPFAVPFTDPGTSSFQGVAGTYAGLLPFNYSSGCSPATDARCTTTLLTWNTAPSLTRSGGTGTLSGTLTCGVDNSTTPPTSYCGSYYQGGAVDVLYDDRIAGVARALRTYDSTQYTVVVWVQNVKTGAWSNPASVASRQFNGDGSFSFKVTATAPNMGSGNQGYLWVITTRPNFSDHALLSTATANTGWFVRNEWYRLVYYAFAQNHAAGGSGTCTSGTNCLTVTTNLIPDNKQRAILILAGRSLTGTARPNGNITDFLDSAENQNADINYEQLKVSKTFNDRVLSVDANP